LYSGLELSQDVESITQYLKKIDRIDEITHVYFADKIVAMVADLIGDWPEAYLAYVHRGWGDEDSEQRIKDNVDFIVNAVAAVEQVCPNLQFWTFPTGGKWYGFEFGDKVERVLPLKENAPRVQAPYGDHIFYYPQVDTLSKLSEGKKWKFADIRPDVIVRSNPPNPEILTLIAIAFRLASSQTTTQW
jgi:hypothetical protein